MARLKITDTHTGEHLGELVLKARRLLKEYKAGSQKAWEEREAILTTIGNIFIAGYVANEAEPDDYTIPCSGCGGQGLTDCVVCNGEGWLEP